MEASAPSNIALIKYMGKTDTVNNRPTNSSLSWTLNNLRTHVRIRQNKELTQDQWSPFIRNDLRPIELSEKGKQKFLDFFAKLKIEFKLSGFFEIESANNFPSDCGLASSASSFAALTLIAHQFAGARYLPKELAKISQKGSGSSCRSFFSPWALWHESGAEEIQLPIKELKHMVILCDETKKTVSSSQAHVQVLTSDLFKGRPERAADRLQKLVTSLRKPDGQWKKIFEICWNEFWDMHTLFHTSVPAFMYINGDGFTALSEILEMWNKDGDGPIVTMDAGSNIHLLFRTDQPDVYLNYLHHFSDKFNLWTDDGYQKNKN
jgi:diphosphomevalonate decarboxylase